MDRSATYVRLLDLNYEDVMESCRVNQTSRQICQDPIFWEDKAQRDYQTSLRQVESDQQLKPREKYLAILSEQGVAKGSEKFTSAQECLRRAVITGRSDLCNYFAQIDDVDLRQALIDATRNKSIFDSLVDQYSVDVYSDPDLIYQLIKSSLDNQNFPLVEDLAPLGFVQITDQGRADDLMQTASQTGQYEYVTYLHPFYYPIDPSDPQQLQDQADDLDEWILQTALIQDDSKTTQALIEEMMNQDRFPALTRSFVRAGDYARLENLVHLEEFNGLSYLGKEIVLDAAKYNRVDILMLIKEDPVFRLDRRRSWFEQGLDVAKQYKSIESIAYLNRLLDEM